MRRELLYNPRFLCERLAIESINRRRLGQLRKTVARELSLGHIDSLELLELVKSENINVIYDVGANVGTWTLLARAIIPSAQIHAFEPLPGHLQGFATRVSNLKNVTVHPVALGASNKNCLIHVTDFSDASSILPIADASRLHFKIREIEQASIQMCRLDDYRVAHDIPLPDVIKLDVQGYELEALKGGQECLRSAMAVLMEVSFAEFYCGQPLFAESYVSWLTIIFVCMRLPPPPRPENHCCRPMCYSCERQRGARWGVDGQDLPLLSRSTRHRPLAARRSICAPPSASDRPWAA